MIDSPKWYCCAKNMCTLSFAGVADVLIHCTDPSPDYSTRASAGNVDGQFLSAQFLSGSRGLVTQRYIGLLFKGYWDIRGRAAFWGTFLL